MRAIIVALALTLGACSTVKTATTPVDMTTMAKSAYAAKATYEGLLIVAVAYNARPPCTTPRTVVTCRDPVVIVQIRKASAAADAATQSAENAVRMLGNEPMLVQAAVVAAEQGVAAFKTVTDIFAR